MRTALNKSITFLIFFYMLSALEVNVGDYVQTFGDEYDSYVQNTKNIDSLTVSTSKLPVAFITIVYFLFTSSYFLLFFQRVRNYHSISFYSPLRLHLRFSLLQI